MEEKFKLIDEMAFIQNITNKNISEINKISSVFKMISSLFEEQINSTNNKLNEFNFEKNKSLLFDNLNSILENIKKFNNDYKNIILKVQNELVNSVELFTINQENIYKENEEELNELLLYYNNNKKILNNSKLNYYKSYYSSKEEENSQIKKKGSFNIIEDELDMVIKDKMEAKNNEIIYKYEIERFNKELDIIKDKYSKIKEKIELAEKSRISFIKTSFNKQNQNLKKLIDLINNYIESTENLFSDDISEKIQQESINEISKKSEETKTSIIISKEKFVPHEAF